MIHRHLTTEAVRRRRPTAWLSLLAVLLPLGLTACSDDSTGRVDDQTSPAATASSASSATPEEPTSSPSTASATPTTDDAAAGRGFVTPFFVGATPQGTRLYRELGAKTRPEDALTVLLDGPRDPDYRTRVPADSLTGDYSFDGTGADGRFSVELTDASWAERPADMSAAQAALAVQQVVWTLQTAQGGDDYDPTLRTKAPVSFTVDGEEVSYLGVASGVSARPPLRVLAMVNVISGLDDAAKGATAVLGGMASSFEATVPWTVTDADGNVVEESFSTAEGWMGGLYPFTAEIDLSDLPPGEYLFTARTDDPSGGEGGGPTEDTKVLTVER